MKEGRKTFLVQLVLKRKLRRIIYIFNINNNENKKMKNGKANFEFVLK
jgi:hypothetical protein